MVGILSNKPVIVISPLISLMQDQVYSLNTRGISACYLGSAQQDMEVWNGAFNNKYNFVYITPELAVQSNFLQKIQQISPCLVAIDEAHCVSEWGHDFRPEYHQLGTIRSHLQGVPFMALTATATKTTTRDIISSLSMHRCEKLIGTFDRPNLIYECFTKSGNPARVMYRELSKNGITIIYMPTIVEVETITTDLNNMGCKTVAYHAQLSKQQKDDAYQKFITQSVRVVVATIAFGMGIDGEVSAVFHWGPAKTLEGYYQQSGRAGRSGKISRCVMWTTVADWIKLKSVAKTAREKTALQEVRNYCDMECGCRRQQIVSYFDETIDLCGMCDLCKGRVVIPNRKKVEEFIQSDVDRVLNAVKQCKGYFGITGIIKFLKGKDRSHNWLVEREGYGNGKDKPDAHWKTIITSMQREGLLKETIMARGKMGGYAAISLSDTGKARMNILPPIFHPVMQELPVNHDLEKFLQQKCEALYIPGNIINNIDIRELSRHAPQTQTQLQEISDGKLWKKCVHYESVLLDLIIEQQQGNAEIRPHIIQQVNQACEFSLDKDSVRRIVLEKPGNAEDLQKLGIHLKHEQELEVLKCFRSRFF
jgi:ATP-dependent DNA helicase RecQ